jgi:hypothetical protein
MEPVTECDVDPWSRSASLEEWVPKNSSRESEARIEEECRSTMSSSIGVNFTTSAAALLSESHALLSVLSILFEVALSVNL